jgi:acyl carrier protein
MSVRQTVISVFEQVAADQEKTLKPLQDELELLNCGLDSLCFAIIVARLEDDLDYDPFSESDEAHFPVTFGGFVKLYDRAAS